MQDLRSARALQPSAARRGQPPARASCPAPGPPCQPPADAAPADATATSLTGDRRNMTRLGQILTLPDFIHCAGLQLGCGQPSQQRCNASASQDFQAVLDILRDRCIATLLCSRAKGSRSCKPDFVPTFCGKECSNRTESYILQPHMLGTKSCLLCFVSNTQPKPTETNLGGEVAVLGGGSFLCSRSVLGSAVARGGGRASGRFARRRSVLGRRLRQTRLVHLLCNHPADTHTCNPVRSSDHPLLCFLLAAVSVEIDCMPTRGRKAPEL